MAEELDEFAQMMALLESTVKKPKKKVPALPKPTMMVKKKKAEKIIQRYFCEICSKFFKSKKNLVSHMGSHLGKNRCHICGKIFAQKSNLVSHMDIHSGERKYICEYCGQSFRQSSCLRRHKHSHLPNEYECSVCGKMLTHPTRLALHMRMHGERKFQCDICGKLFTQKSHLNTHMLLHTGEKKHKCNDCGKQFTHKSTLEAHSVTHTGIKKYECPYCGRKFSQRGGLKCHVDTHLGIKRFECPVCKKRFTQKGALKVHMHVHNGQRYECRECGRRFKHKNTLKAHIINQHEIKEGRNEISHNMKIKVHSRPDMIKVNTRPVVLINDSSKNCEAEPAFLDTDNDEPSFCCGQCGSSYKSLIDLSEHMELHNVTPDHFIKAVDDGMAEGILPDGSDVFTMAKKGHKSYECDKCGKLFSYKSTLSTHQKVTHSSVKQYKCSECSKEFARKSYLDVHMVVHTGERRYRCDECGKSFTQKGSLNVHASVHAECNPYLKCADCGVMFNKSSDLFHHKKDNHDVKIEIHEQDLFSDMQEEEDLCILVEIEPVEEDMLE